ncbi:MAG: hypothetical protein JWM95_1919 [Gemmatimonadetes bacterium]|nr:hypothetical protein [Gemmatimonadota bacterium]
MGIASNRCLHYDACMANADYRGARGAMAGLDYHVLWTLRHALSLLDAGSELTAITVEGLRAEDEVGVSAATWDGVDCTFYHGGNSTATATQIDVDQLKYSAAEPDAAWTVARLARSSAKRTNNSVIRRLAQAFDGLRTTHASLVREKRVRFRLVSNQPVKGEIRDALRGGNGVRAAGASSKRETLRKASGLSAEHFATFAELLDLSQCGSDSRFALEESALRTVAGWTEEGSRALVDVMMRSVERMMLPESGGYITRESVLSWLDYSDPAALLPCPSRLEQVMDPISRAAAREVAALLARGQRRICLHGGGGSGKTTALQEIETALPAGSTMIVFDCYGAGTYLDADQLRHRARDAFTQLSNELASRLRVPLLLTRTEADYPRAFAKRLRMAADIVRKQGAEEQTSDSGDGDALLVIVVDAADNSVTAAKQRSPRETSFVHDFMLLGKLPHNVRLVVTCRTGRLDLVEPPSGFELVPLLGFARPETEAHISRFFEVPSPEWIEDFQHFTRGNPRVQRYALDFGRGDAERALDFLRPSGKSLEQLFGEQLKLAVAKGGSEREVTQLCAGLVAMPRPIPVEDLAAVVGVTAGAVLDLCSDLAPGIREVNGLIAFADEDFEQFIRAVGGSDLETMTGRLADHLYTRRHVDAYAATHVSAAMYGAERNETILELVNDDQSLLVIKDPVVRREVQVQRLRVAMRVSREAGDDVSAIMTLLAGADALKTDEAIRKAFTDHPELAAEFARESVARTVLRDPEQIERHGRVLFQLLAADARAKDRIAVREGRRQLNAWLERRRHAIQSAEKAGVVSYGAWPIEPSDIAAEVEAVLRVGGAKEAIANLARWSPRHIALRVGLELIPRLLPAARTLVWEVANAGGLPKAWTIFALVPLALSGETVESTALVGALNALVRRGLLRQRALSGYTHSGDSYPALVELAVTACELAAARGASGAELEPVLAILAGENDRREERLSVSNFVHLDVMLRGYALREALVGGEATLDAFLVPTHQRESGEESENELRRRQRQVEDHRKELREVIGPFFAIYTARAELLALRRRAAGAEQLLSEATQRLDRDSYRIQRNHYAWSLKERVCVSGAKLIGVPGIDMMTVWRWCRAVGALRDDSNGRNDQKTLAVLAMQAPLHKEIVALVGLQAKDARETRIAGSEKVDRLARRCYLLRPISATDAAALFTQAIEAAQEIDADALSKLALVEALATVGSDALDLDARRSVAREVAVVADDAAVRLDRGNDFPWDAVIGALTRLDVPTTLAAAGRWHDADSVALSITLPHLLTRALRDGALSARYAAALLFLCDHNRLSVHKALELQHRALASTSLGSQVDGMIAELARQERLMSDSGMSPSVERMIRSVPEAARDGNMARLIERTEFNESVRERALARTCRPAMGDASTEYVPRKELDATTRAAIAVRDRIVHIEALVATAEQSDRFEARAACEALVDAVGAWRDSPAVAAWANEYGPAFVTKRLPALTGYLGHGGEPPPFVRLLELSNAGRATRAVAILGGIERHIDELHPSTILGVLQTTASNWNVTTIADVLKRYVTRLLSAVPAEENATWTLGDVPQTTSGALSRLLFAQLGDCEIAQRWRAAHCVRSLARLGVSGVLDSLAETYEREDERTFKDPQTPFYVMAARLWLAIAAARAAEEAPAALRGAGVDRDGVCLGSRLLEIAKNKSLPHVLLREFAKTGALALVRSGDLKVTAAERRTLQGANRTVIPRTTAKYGGVRYDKYKHDKMSRLHFESDDDTVYFINAILESFADVSPSELLDRAERWVFDVWGARGEITHFINQPPRVQAASESFREGRRFERYDRYLETHGLWCAAGELLKDRPLSKRKADRRSFEDLLTREGLAVPPHWLSDLRGHKPLEEHLWLAPSDADAWVGATSDEEFLREFILTGNDLVVSGYVEVRSRSFRSTVSVRTALVDPRASLALIRALQTVESSWDYRIPYADDELEIIVPPYVMVGWLENVERPDGIDRNDPFRHDVEGQQVRTSIQARRILHAPLRYECWGDDPGDGRRDRWSYDETVWSAGHRLQIGRDALQALLARIGADLVVEINIDKRNRGNESRYDDDEEVKVKEVEFDRVLLLREDGSIEGAKGRVGTW